MAKSDFRRFVPEMGTAIQFGKSTQEFFDAVIPARRSLQSMMKSGAIAAGFTGPAEVGRAGPPVSGWDKADAAGADADTYPELIADAEQTEADWFRRSGIYPIHGLIVVKDECIERDPGLPRSPMDAFVAAI